MPRLLDDLIRHAAARPLTACITLMLIVLTTGALVWPESSAKRERRIAEQLDKGAVVEIAKGEDGAQLWAVRRDGRTIYFSKGSVAIDGEEEQGATM